MLRRFSTQKEKEVLSSFEPRIQGIMLIILLIFGMLVFRLWTLQHLERNKYLKLAQRNYLRTMIEPAMRGRIFDRQGHPLAENIPVYDLMVNWAGIPRKTRPESLSAVSELFNMTVEEVEQRLKEARPNRYGDRRLIAEIPFDRVVAVREAQAPGVNVHVRPQRHYPYGEAAGHLIGFMGEINRRELDRHENYRLGEWVGKLGLERRYEFDYPVLKGKDGLRRIQVSANGLMSREIADGYVPSVPGNDIWTTLDIGLQQATEKILGASRGAIVAMDPWTGDILAMVSRPGYDPNVFVKASRVDERAEALRNQFNLALNGSYACGSVFKIVVATAGLEEEVVDPEDTFHCSGRFKIGGGYKHCHIWWNYNWGHGDMDIEEAMQRSCDVYFYNLGQKMGKDKILDYARKVYGLVDPPKYRYQAPGQEEPFSLVGEDPDPGSVIRAKLMKGRRGWFGGDTLNLAIGQGELAMTPLQVAVMLSVQATGGKLYQPRLVTKVTDPDGQVLEQFPVQLVSEAEISPETLEAVNNGLSRVVNHRYGTAYESRIEGIEVLGKTGTAEKGLAKGQTDAWFGCFAPREKPEIAIAVVVPLAGHGGDVSAPLAKEVLEYYFRDRLQKQISQARR